MSICDEIVSARNFGVVRCGVSSQASPGISDLALEFGLASDPANYREIDTATAVQLLEWVLRQDMAYDAEIMTADQAAELASRFLAQFGSSGIRYYTNIEFCEPSGFWSGRSWNPVTNAAFDTGVLIIGIRKSGCLWIEDED